jgi:hypothetical protein
LTYAVIGSDPGMSGAFALILGGQLSAIYDMPTLELPGKKSLSYNKEGQPVEKIGKKHKIDMHGVRRVFANWRDYAKVPLVLVAEEMWSRSGQDVTRMDRLLYGSGLVVGIAVGLNFGIKQIAPATWKAQMGVSASKKTSLDKAKELAQDEPDSAKWAKMFSRKLDNGRAEAYLIARWGYKEINKDG